MLSLDEIGLIPSKEPTNITSRSKVDPYTDDSYMPYKQGLEKGSFFPVFVSPMTSVVNKENMCEFKKEGFIPILPRNYTFEERIELCKTDWVAFSLQELYKINEDELFDWKSEAYILIDIANGHIGNLYIEAKRLKDLRYQSPWEEDAEESFLCCSRRNDVRVVCMPTVVPLTADLWSATT